MEGSGNSASRCARALAQVKAAVVRVGVSGEARGALPGSLWSVRAPLQTQMAGVRSSVPRARWHALVARSVSSTRKQRKVRRARESIPTGGTCCSGSGTHSGVLNHLDYIVVGGGFLSERTWGMKVTVVFADTAVVVPCKDGWTVQDLTEQATRRYRRILEQVKSSGFERPALRPLTNFRKSPRFHSYHTWWLTLTRRGHVTGCLFCNVTAKAASVGLKDALFL